jgi:hypothetical protein
VPNVRLSGTQTSARCEADIRVNYFDTDKIIAASNSYERVAKQTQFYSTDGGATWKQSTLPLHADDSHHCDPAVDWTSDGTAWAITIGCGWRGNALRVYKSTDGGAPWTFDTTISDSHTGVDREVMWVDRSTTSPFKDQIYCAWHNDTHGYVARRTTGPGAAWHTAVQVTGSETTGSPTGNDIKSNSAGEVFIFWPDDGSHKLWFAKSTKGAAHFGAPAEIATICARSLEISIPADTDRKTRVFVTGGCYRTATKDMVYAMWPDLSSKSDCGGGHGPDSHADSNCKERIWFTRSIDGGKKWETPRMINDQPSKNDQFFSHLVVDETDGRLVAIYYDTVGDPARKKSNIWLQSSSDDGQTWSAATKITTAPTDECFESPVGESGRYGEYIGLSGVAGNFFACWTDRRGGDHEEIWGATIVLAP